ncbi:MAG: 16S rRNA (adenine(1518)-N(6)/adenine(1519)-N(6))-dimethyltransferase RsmA [Elusimicrobiota bacterium]
MHRPPLSQNFLIDKNISRKIVESAGIRPQDSVIEIGPGKGILTEFILEKTRNLIAVEIDKNLAGELLNNIRNKFNNEQLKNFKLVTDDFLNFRIPKKRSFIFVSNLPYQAASIIIKKCISTGNWKRAVFTLQKEVAERITAQPGKKNYGVLTLQVMYFCNVKKLFNINRSCFWPVPKVDSSVISLTKSSELKKIPYNTFNRVITAAFSQRRKTVLNSLTRVLKTSKDIVIKILIKHKIPLNSRAEQITFEKFLLISLDIKNKIW